MRRPLGLWIFLSAGVLLLNIQDVHGLRGRKSTTSTTTSSTNDSSEESSEEEADTTEVNVETSTNSTKHVLTGNPQIDYIWDPNLPKELNGYNLSDYPFYERVPENITFKCDGLHDGFYASVLYKCQVYHHCLFGIRYDFLCANYTAFDQTLFNCNFVSKVDCKNSKNFWSRNDELYKENSTPAPAPPPLVYSFYTQAPPTFPSAGSQSRRNNPLLRRIPPPNVYHAPTEVAPAQVPGTTQTGSGPPAEVVAVAQAPIEVPLAPRRRLRPRPAYDYYDEYDEPQVYRRKRPRPRPYYDDEDYEYYEDRYDRRGEGRRRRPYDRPMRRYKGRRDKYEEEDDVYDEYEEEPRRKVGSMSGNRRRQQPRRQYVAKSNKKPADYYYDDEYEDNKKPQAELNKNRRQMDEYEDEQDEDNKKTVIKPTIFERTRPASKINLPVPKNVAKGMSSKPKESAVIEEETIKSTIVPDMITTMRGNFKRPYLSRKSSQTRKTRPEPEEPVDEIQESKPNIRQTTVRVKSPGLEEKEVKRPQNQERRGYLSRVNMYKTRHSLSTPTGEEIKDEDLTEIDDSINEA